MRVNHFATPVSSATATRSGLKVPLLWFLLGFACSWVSWSTIAYLRMRPRDVTQVWPEELREMAPDWMKHAKSVVVGGFVLVTPGDHASANAIVYPLESPSIGVTFSDEDGDRRLDEIMVADARQRTWSIQLNATHQEAASFCFSSRFAHDSVTYEDGNVDGQYDTRCRLGEDDPKKRVSVWIDSQWRPCVLDDGKRYAEIDGTAVEVRLVDGVWQRTEMD